jgi:hypothetical protein
MPSDRSRRTDDLRDGYKEVVAQQGRVILDRDFNALQGLTSERIAADALDVVGPSGTPDNGFEISLPHLSPPGPPLWSPPGGFGPLGPQDFDFLISPGTMYVGGQRAALPGRQAGHAVTYSYFDQPDWVDPDEPGITLSPPGEHEFVYLDVEEQEVSAVEDPDLLEVALGGPDTTQRIKLMRRVKRQPVASADCAGAWKGATAQWLQRDGLQFDPRTMRLEPVVRLQVGFTQDVSVHDPCDPVATGGYLGADNQLIRVQISHSGTPEAGGEAGRLLWSFDNASFLYRITSVSADGMLLTLAADPPDALHIPQTGQLVEILLTGAVLGKEPDETDPTGQRSILRVIAETSGELRRLAQPYGPITTGDPTKYIVLDAPLDPAYAQSATPLFLRVWQAELSFDAAGDTVPLNDPATGTSTGVQVTISVPPGEVATKGAFWLLAMRPSTPQAVYPERLLTEPQRPDGPRHWVCPLAVIDWQTSLVEDCRCHFDNLVTLTKRPGSCCTVRVSPEQLTASNTLRSIIDRAATLAQSVTVCLGPGTYLLSEPLRLGSGHSNMIIESCGGDPILAAAVGGGAGTFATGLIALNNAVGVTLRGLKIQVPEASLGEAMIIMIGISATSAPGLTLDRCSFQFMPPPGPPKKLLAGFGLLLEDDCSGLTLRGCAFVSNIPTTLTPVSPPSPPAPSPPAPSPPGPPRPAPGPTPPTPTPPRPITGTMPDVTATPETTAAPVGFAEEAHPSAVRSLLLDRTALAALLRREISARAGLPAAFVVTLGVVGSPSLGGQPCRLGDCLIEGNSYDNFTAALVGRIDARTARITANKVVNCVAGIWVELAGYTPPSPSKMSEQLQQIVTALRFFEETSVVATLVNALQPDSVPAGVSVTPGTLFVTENEIEAMPDNNQGSTALMILANRAVVPGQDTSVSLVIANNRLRNQSPRQPNVPLQPVPPTTLLVIADAARCAVTGNLIFYEQGGRDVAGDSLDIITNSGTQARLLAITGNVLLGATTITELVRSDDPANGNWLLYNSFLRSF